MGEKNIIVNKKKLFQGVRWWRLLGTMLTKTTYLQIKNLLFQYI
jgi:hypothetical protein